jgi:hypothetical protein
MLTNNPVYNLTVVFNHPTKIKRLYNYLVKSNAMPRSEIRSFIIEQFKRDWNMVQDPSIKSKLATPETWAWNAKPVLDTLDNTYIKEPKTLKFNKRANKDYPAYGIRRGEPHYSWNFQGVTLRSKDNPFKPQYLKNPADVNSNVQAEASLEVTKTAA